MPTVRCRSQGREMLFILLMRSQALPLTIHIFIALLKDKINRQKMHVGYDRKHVVTEQLESGAPWFLPGDSVHVNVPQRLQHLLVIEFLTGWEIHDRTIKAPCCPRCIAVQTKKRKYTKTFCCGVQQNLIYICIGESVEHHPSLMHHAFLHGYPNGTSLGVRDRVYQGNSGFNLDFFRKHTARRRYTKSSAL